MGARTRSRGMYPVPYAARFDPSGVADEASAPAMPAVPFRARASERRTDDAGLAEWNPFRITAGRILYELPFTGTRLESSLRGEADALALKGEMQ